MTYNLNLNLKLKFCICVVLLIMIIYTRSMYKRLTHYELLILPLFEDYLLIICETCHLHTKIYHFISKTTTLFFLSVGNFYTNPNPNVLL